MINSGTHAKFEAVTPISETVLGSVHIGIGSSMTLAGNVQAACHYDLIKTGVTLEVDGEFI